MLQGAAVQRVDGVGDNFFELGGCSLLAAQGVSRVRELPSVELPLREFFAMLPIARVAARIEALQADPGPARIIDELTWLASTSCPAGVTGNREDIEL